VSNPKQIAKTTSTLRHAMAIFINQNSDDDTDTEDDDGRQLQRQRHSTSFVLFYYLRQNWKILLFGQVLSLLLAGAGAAQATLHLDCGLSAPTFTMALIYFGLSFHLVYMILVQKSSCCRRKTNYNSSWIPLFNQRQKNAEGQYRHVPGQSQGLEEEQLHNESRNGLRITSRRFEEDSIVTSLDTKSTPVEDHNDHQSQIATHDEDVDVVATDGSELENDEDGADPPAYSFLCGFLPLHRPVWWYLLLAIFDVEANTVTLLAFRYTTLTSVTLFDALAIPSAMIVSKCWLHRQYKPMHCLAVVICMAGVVVNVMQDYESDLAAGSNNNHVEEDGAAKEQYPHKVWGDLCAITGGLLYGLNDVLTEITVRHNKGTTEYLGMMGLFAFLISLVQAFLLERDDIMEFFGRSEEGDETSMTQHSATCSLRMGWILLLTFVGVTLLSYISASRFLMISEAAFFNLSLLTGDLWSLFFSVVAEDITPSPLFFVALVLVLSGVVLYEMAPSPALPMSRSDSYDFDDVDTGRFTATIQKNHRLIASEDEKEEEQKEGAEIEMNETASIV
jgi:solute carrier family 35, member F1/2